MLLRLSFFGICLFSIIKINAQAVSYSFIVAGHAYGAHSGENIGLHPLFLESLNNGIDQTVAFFVFAGDIVNRSTEESWAQLEVEMEAYGLPYYCAMGNHDNNAVAHDFYEQNYGNDYYAFDYQNDRYIFLNSTLQDRSISTDQMEFLEQNLALENEVNNVFIIFHEVIWNSNIKYKDTRSNSRSRYENIKDLSNYWDEVHPLLTQHNDKNIFVISGDVGGNPDAISAFYDQIDNVTLISSGMGEVYDENYLQIDVLDNGSTEFKLVALQEETVLKDLELYCIPPAPEEIRGEASIENLHTPYEYLATHVAVADSYLWEIPEFASGSSSTNSIDVSFLKIFTQGEIKVSAALDGYGCSAPTIFPVSFLVNIASKDIDAEIIAFTQNKQLTINPFNQKINQVKLFNAKGILIQTFQISNATKGNLTLNTNTDLKGIYILQLFGNDFAKSLKLYFE